MNTSNYLSFNDIEKLCNEKTEATVYCKHCGHSMNISKKIGKRPCTHCGYYVFIDDKEEFKYRLLSSYKGAKRKDV